MGMKRAAIKSLGITFLMFLLACATVCIILAGIVYRFANPDFVSSGYSSVSQMLVASIVYAFFVGFLGFCVFLYPKTGLLMLFEALLFLSFLFTLAIAIYALVAGSTSYPNIQYGCDARITGILDVWRGMDDYLGNVDRALCSQACPCRVNNTDVFRNNPNTVAAFNTWTVQNKEFAATSFPQCSSEVQSNALSAVNSPNNPRYFPQSFDPNAFASYMGRVEREFNCVGWCQTYYYLSADNRNVIRFSKYLFSDINRGVPEYIGCIQRLIHWLPGYLLAWGSVAMVLAGIELILFALALMLAASRKKEGGHDVIHHERVEVIEQRQ